MIVQPVVEPMDRFAALVFTISQSAVLWLISNFIERGYIWTGRGRYFLVFVCQIRGNCYHCYSEGPWTTHCDTKQKLNVIPAENSPSMDLIVQTNAFCSILNYRYLD